MGPDDARCEHAPENYAARDEIAVSRILAIATFVGKLTSTFTILMRAILCYDYAYSSFIGELAGN